MIKSPKNNGQIIILFPFVLIIIIGLLGLVTDLGHAYYIKIKMQQAVDAATLAAVQELPDNPETAIETAKYYSELNELDRNIIEVTTPYKSDPCKIHAAASKQVNFFFAPIIGINSMNISVSSVAGIFYANENSIFNHIFCSASKDELFEISGSNSTVHSSVHINGTVKISGSHWMFLDNFECADFNGKVDKSVKFKDLVVPGSFIPLPSFDIEGYQNRATTVYNSDFTISNSAASIEGIIYVNGDVYISDSNIRGQGIIVATGNIYISDSNIRHQANNDLVCFYSLGDIEISGSTQTFEGVAYAPEGMIKISGSNNTFRASFAAKYFEPISGSYNTFHYDSRIKEILESKKSIKLIE